MAIVSEVEAMVGVTRAERAEEREAEKRRKRAPRGADRSNVARMQPRQSRQPTRMPTAEDLIPMEMESGTGTYGRF
jgi:hypothetical protein